MSDTSNTENTEFSEHIETEPDGTYTDEQTKDGKTTVEHGDRHSEGGAYTDSELDTDVDRAERHD